MRFTSISDPSGAQNTVNYNVLCLFSFKNHPPMVARSLKKGAGPHVTPFLTAKGPHPCTDAHVFVARGRGHWGQW